MVFLLVLSTLYYIHMLAVCYRMYNDRGYGQAIMVKQSRQYV